MSFFADAYPRQIDVADYTKVLPLLTESFAASFNPCKLACVAERGETSKESNTLPLFRFQVRSTSL